MSKLHISLMEICGEIRYLQPHSFGHPLIATLLWWRGLCFPEDPTSDTRITGRVFHYKLVLDKGAKNSSMTP